MKQVQFKKKNYTSNQTLNEFNGTSTKAMSSDRCEVFDFKTRYPKKTRWIN